MYNCQFCHSSYVWPHDLTRHTRRKHNPEQQGMHSQHQLQEHPQRQQQQQHQEVHSQQQQEMYSRQQQQQQQQEMYSQQQQQQQQDMVFRHPFTGPTSCRKTYFVTKLLQNCQSKIVPTPQRIIWLYRRWQPLYDDIKTSVFPKIEFIEGLPLDLEQDSFIDPAKRNLIVLDDLMSTAAKDPRINDMFT